MQSPTEAVRALCLQIPGFEEEIKKGWYRVTRIYENGIKHDYNNDTIAMTMGRATILRIEPIAQGRKQGLLNIVFGAVLVGAAFLLTGGVLSAPALTLFGQTITGTQLALVGGVMAIAGVSAMLAPQMKQDADENKEKSSAMINTPTNRIEQGHCVPIVYGRRVFVGSVVINNAINVEEFDDGE